MGRIKVEITELHFDGEKRLRPGQVIMIDESAFQDCCMKKLSGGDVESAPSRKKKSMKVQPKDEDLIEAEPSMEDDEVI